jgi:hypothetical protein
LLCSPGWPGTRYVDQASLKVIVLLPLPPECWNCRHEPECWLIMFIFFKHHLCDLINLERILVLFLLLGIGFLSSFPPSFILSLSPSFPFLPFFCFFCSVFNVLLIISYIFIKVLCITSFSHHLFISFIHVFMCSCSLLIFHSCIL